MRWTRMSVVAVLLVTAALPARANVTVDPSGASPEAAARAQAGVDRWQSALSARSGCLGSATITFGQLSGRKGEYNTRTAVVTIDPDVPAASVELVVIHELSHHLMLSCGAYGDAAFTAAFYAAQGIPADRGWFDYSAGWSSAPAEIFAEAVTAVVNGGTAYGIATGSATQKVTRAWMANQVVAAPVPTTTPSTTAPASSTPSGAGAGESPVVSTVSTLITSVTTVPAPPAVRPAVVEVPQPAPAQPVRVVLRSDACELGCRPSAAFLID